MEEALKAGKVPAFVFYSEAFREKDPGQALLNRLRGLGVPCYEVSEAVMAALSSTVTPQGLVGVMPFFELPRPASKWLTLILDGVKDPGNLGAILRSAAAAGVSEVILTWGSGDIYNPKVVRAAMGAHFYLCIHRGLKWEQITPLIEGRQVLLAEASGDTPYFEVDWTEPSVLVIGGEAHGPGPQAREAAQKSIYIPMAGTVESLNAAVAAGIIIFEAVRQRTLKNPLE